MVSCKAIILIEGTYNSWGKVGMIFIGFICYIFSIMSLTGRGLNSNARSVDLAMRKEPNETTGLAFIVALHQMRN